MKGLKTLKLDNLSGITEEHLVDSFVESNTK